MKALSYLINYLKAVLKVILKEDYFLNQSFIEESKFDLSKIFKNKN